MSAVASVETIRAAFPALERVHGGHPVAYLDGPGGTQVPMAVVNGMQDYLLHHNANTHWNYPTSNETDATLFEAREVFARFLGGAPDEISFGNNMTTITFHAARGLGRDWRAGDEVIVTELDHHGNIAPWQALARERGIVLKWLPLDVETGQLRLDTLHQLVGPRTRLLAIGAASNVLGTVNDVPLAARIAHDAGALVFVDGVHSAPHVLPDVAALGCDLFVCSPYKFYGPHAGVLWGRRELLERIDVPRLEPAPDTSPERFETGTQNHEGIWGSACAVRWLASLSRTGGELRTALSTTYDESHRRAGSLLAALWDGLGALDGVTRYGPPPGAQRTPTVSFTVRDIDPSHVAAELARQGCFVSHGDFYASTVTRVLGHERDGLVRIGAACYTSEAEVARVLDALEQVR